MKNAFTYMFKDNMWFKKSLLIFALLLLQMGCPLISGALSRFSETIVQENISAAFCCLIAILIISGIGFVASILYCGYFINCIKAVSVQKENIVLPFVNIKQNLITGFKYTVAVALYILEMIGVILIPLFLLAIPATKILGVVLLIIAILFVVFIFFTCSMGFVRLFAETESMTAFAKFKQIPELIKDKKKQYFLSILLNGAFSMLLSVFAFSFPQGIGFIIYVLLAPYATFVTAHLFARCIDKERFQLIEK